MRDAGSNWGHRDNLLDPKHNRVSVGIAYDGDSLYLVQDFEDYYVTGTNMSQTFSVIDLTFTSTKSNWNPNQIEIYYDPLPQPLTVAQLKLPPYDSSYGQGTYVAGVLPKGWTMQNGVTISASQWTVTNGKLHVILDTSSVYALKGKGVYTLMVADSSGFWTNYSIWNKLPVITNRSQQ